MNSVTQTARRARAHATGVVGALAGLMLAQNALAVGTEAGTSVSNVATVDYAVGGVAQTPIESSPTGNSTAGTGAGTPTAFVVDAVIDLTVSESDGSAVPVTPGQTGVVATFTVGNTGNTANDFALSVAYLTCGNGPFGDTDDEDVDNLSVFVDADANGTYEPGTDTSTFIDELAADATATVFVVADVPLDATNDAVANVQLTAEARASGSAGALGAALVESTGADDPAVVDIVFGDDDGNAAASGDHTFLVQSASLAITKSSVVVRDPVNGTTNPKAIPFAVVEYTIQIENTGSVDAVGVRVTDVLDGSLVLVTGEYAGSDVEYDDGSGGGAAQCTADAADTDGCDLTGTTLTVDPGITVQSGNTATVRFRVEIQ
jgi:hypothetical protein